ncbi:XrtA/PEP-CTERM system histidine kinase PrsK [Tsuneonella suprasediminis]|uniref:XrtA/PEP-CTERM system histidine kinase PrsK n=1 Tax=Tsuneonella suprasediminis TaxID=2306996 RepID=UPI002F92575B
MVGDSFWGLIEFFLNLLAAVVCVVVSVWLTRRRADTSRQEQPAMILALLTTSAWCVTAAAFGGQSHLSGWLETIRNLAWIFLLYRLFANDGRDHSLTPIRPLVVVLAAVECMQVLLLIVGFRLDSDLHAGAILLSASSLLHLLVAVGALVLTHNLYAGASATYRQTLRWSAGGLAILWAFQLNLYAATYLTGTVSPELIAVQGLFIGLSAGLFALGSNTRAAQLQLAPSRTVAFQSLSLLIIGGYLLTMLVAAQSLELLGEGFARLTQVGFVFAAIAMAVLWLPSRRLRGWLQVKVLKHLFQHRYDYRAEWLRFADTIGQGGTRALPERACQALADITDSDGAVLFLPDTSGDCQFAGHWNWVTFKPALSAFDNELIAALERTGFILEIDEIRSGATIMPETSLVPQWLLSEERAWVLVPLMHFERLVGLAILARPPIARRLDWEDFDLLKVVGRQLASYIAEQVGHEALAEVERFDDFNRRIAFVMHDIKNLASQLSLLARNAEKHADNPAFRSDMLVTLTSSASKLNTLLARLGRYGSVGTTKKEHVDVIQLTRALARQFVDIHPIQIAQAQGCSILANQEALEQAMVHLIQNAVDVSPPNAPVIVSVLSDGLKGQVEIIDSGSGMSAQFVRDGLFKPFVSSKQGGFGIGAYEARELIRAMGGLLEVESHEGLGTRFVMTFPLSIMPALTPAGTDDGREVA